MKMNNNFKSSYEVEIREKETSSVIEESISLGKMKVTLKHSHYNSSNADFKSVILSTDRCYEYIADDDLDMLLNSIYIAKQKGYTIEDISKIIRNIE